MALPLRTVVRTILFFPLTIMAVRLHSVRTPMKLASSVPTIVWIHGLDSSLQTWTSIVSHPRLVEKGVPSISLSCRGAGQSPLGEFDDFSTRIMTLDIRTALEDIQKPFILVGHSMGGRAAMEYAATHPEDLCALVIEDMDIQQRFMSSSALPMKRDQVMNFSRSFRSRQDAVDALRAVGYPQEYVERWIEGGRIYPTNKDDSSWWSDVNPQFRYLCYKHFFETDSGRDSWKKIAHTTNFPCHVMVADPEFTVCSDESIQEMRELMPRVRVHRYPGASHSIHSSDTEGFIDTIEGILKDVSAAAS